MLNDDRHEVREMSIKKFQALLNYYQFKISFDDLNNVIALLADANADIRREVCVLLG